jgi:acyl-CoA thioesterase
VPGLEELTEREAAAVAATRAAGQRAVQTDTSVSEQLLPIVWEPGLKARARGSLPIGPELGNRVGAIQGGALYAAAAAAASTALADPSAMLVEGTYQFIRPAFGQTLLAEATVLRRGSSVAYAEARLLADDKLVGAGLFTYQLEAGKESSKGL